MTELQFFERMQEAMAAQAEDVWEMVHHSRALGYRLRLGEVTATEHSFFRLREFWTKRVYIVTNEPDELATGADWEWLIGHGNNWIQIRVQAKILNRNGRFAELGHPHSTGQQLDRLVNPDPADVLCRWLPLYVFYSAEPSAGIAVPRNAGCSAQLASRVRETYGKPPAGRATLKGSTHLRGSIPWASVFDGLVSQLRSGRSLAEIVAALANRPLPAQIDHIDEFWDLNIADGTCNRELPSYVRQIVRRDDDDFDLAPLARLEVNTAARGRDRVRSVAPITDLERLEAMLVRRFGDDDSSALLPSRSVVLEPSDHDRDQASLPSFVSVIDIDRVGSSSD
ncbi:hypothetical protein MK786_05365 [Microbacterium sp. CFH 31415]|uniref:DUF6615 family protein n=1 Tax=Microbacterium sp. CFH 31415 TaxID=2921732 RepID=UPI001F146E12|nr:DUF6615 family protein [Microbacterium sp. CFH 31415]MCH6230162.1 hypothetical protein [Microbacterium sp. CFH 31415]